MFFLTMNCAESKALLLISHAL